MSICLSRRMRLRWINRDVKTKIGWTFFALTTFVLFLDSFGLVKVYFEKDFETEFAYPLQVEDFADLVHRYKKGEHVEIEPINTNYSDIKFSELANQGCGEPIGLLILVKSAPSYFKKREAIRATWGNAEYLVNISHSISAASPLITCFQNYLNATNHPLYHHKRTPKNSKPNLFPIKLVFLIGKQNELDSNSFSTAATVSSTMLPFPTPPAVGDDDLDLGSNKLPEKDSSSQKTSNRFKTSRLRRGQSRSQKLVEESLRQEILKYDDIVRADFVDSYVNNTYKTMMGFRWALEICPDFQYTFLVDDDMYISMKNLIKFAENPVIYPEVSGNLDTSASASRDFAREDVFAGKVIITRPVRNKLGTSSKWYLSLDEYPYSNFPPYLPAAAILMSKSVVENFHYASLFTQHFRFDDIFLGILAFKMNISPISSNYFHVCHGQNGICSQPQPGEISEADPMDNVVAKHGLANPKELITLWMEQKRAGKV